MRLHVFRSYWLVAAGVGLSVLCAVFLMGYKGLLLPLTCPKGESSACVESYLVTEARWFGLRPAFHTFNAMYAQREMFSRECHVISHALGEFAYEKYEASGRFEPLRSFSNCGYGFYHGFMQALIRKTGTIERSREFCIALQEGVSGARDIFDQCMHGFGHGVVAGYEPGVFKTVDEYAVSGLEACRDIATTSEERMQCAGGVYNGIAIASMDPQSGIQFTPDNPYEMCLGQADSDFREGCFRGAHSAVSHVFENRFLPAARAIEKLPYEDASNALDHLSKYQARFMTKPDTDPYILKMCERLESALQHVCVLGFAKGLIYFVPSHKATQRGTQFCNTDGFPAELKSACFQTVAYFVRDLSGSRELRQLCSEIPSSYTEECTEFL